MTVAAWAAWIATAALVFSGVQASIALRKLRLDLFSKRFETWEAINDAIEAWRSVCGSVSLDKPEEGDGGAARRRFGRLRQQMTLLFPPEVADCLARIEAALQAYMQAAVYARERPVTPSREAGEAAVARLNASIAAQQKTWDLQGELMALAFPYMRQFGWFETAVTPRARRVRNAATRLRRRREDQSAKP